MTDYIERETFIEDIKTEITNLKLNGLKGTPRPCDELYGFIDRIKEQPSVDDVAPVVHGKWVNGEENCPICGKSKFEGLDADIWADWKPNFCPNCGAKMDREDEDDAD